MAFLSDLGGIINKQFSFGDNTNSSLDNVEGSYGKLGKFASKFDHTANRTYIEDGLVTNIRPKLREVLFQQPDITVIIKKKMFSSLLENYKLDLLEEKERLFIRAAKRLFQNKCRILAAYERLCKAERISVDTGQFNTSLLPVVLRDIEELDRAGFSFFDNDTRAHLTTLRRALSFSDTSEVTSWINDYDSAFVGVLGEGTGVIELTTVTNLSTTVSLSFGGGSASFSIEDPYKILRITQKDIDQAISDVQSFFKNSPFGLFTERELTKSIEDLKTRLNEDRFARGASPIQFIVSPQSIISKKVRAINEREGREIRFEFSEGLVGLGGGVTIDPTEIGTSQNLLNSEEANLFQQIVANIYQLIGLTNTTQVKIREFNQETNYVRNRMRLMFSGKAIIQNLDIVNVFMTTKTTEDTSLTAGFPGFQTTGQLATGQLINNLLRNINGSLNDLSGMKTSPDEIEKAAIVGSNFPTWLWRMFKNNFTKANAGTAVFVGLVKTVNQTYDASSGRHIVSVTCEDNASYFNKSQINFKPSISVFNSSLYDPLTPFDVSFDAATGKSLSDLQEGEIPPLLPENQKLLSTRALKFKSTDLKGQNANQILYQTKKSEIVFGKLRRILSDCDGFVYRWKQGIQSITRPESLLNGRQESAVALTANPFAGQDVMNVLSLLVTGQPYNFNTFLQGAIANANDISAYDPSKNEDYHSSYIDGLIRQLSNRNVIWGNFIPFKSLSINDEAFAFIRKGQSDLTKRQNRLNSLIRQRAAKADERALQVTGSENDLDSIQEILNSIDVEISLLDEKIERETNLFSLSESNVTTGENSGLLMIGNDISLEPGFSDDNGSNAITEEQRAISRADFRRRINSLTLRRLWKVKANNDANLFVVDDQYDKNYDIQAFERKIGNKLDLFNSEYLTVDSQIKTVADILGLEVFADSQGNIVVRPPLYNKMPSSVFYKMFKDRAETGAKVFPDFLETLLFNQVNSITNRLEIIEDEIRYRAIALGYFDSNDYNTDIRILNFIRGGAGPSSGGSVFSFLTDPMTGKINGQMIQSIPLQASPDKREQIENKNIEALEGLNAQASRQLNVSKAFDVLTRVRAVTINDFSQPVSDQESQQTKLTKIKNRLLKNKGVNVKSEQELIYNKGRRSNLASLSVLNEIAALVSERQSVVKKLSNVTKNLQEGLLVNANDSGAKSALTPFLNRKTSIPSILEHMIEDESIDDLGYGSGNRFVIKDSQIIRISISENAPPFTAVQVNGLFAEGFVDPTSRLQANISGATGGNSQVSAYAVDYDLWYQYGFIAPNSVYAPWASDPEAQCAPFAVSLLNKARKNIFGGNVVINGYNEYYQAGDVVYIESYEMLFYVTAVSHDFSYSGSLSTTLSLSYGHNPGEYIPTHLDMIGKYLYSSQGYSESNRSSRFGVDGDDISIGSIVIGNKKDINGILSGPNGTLNKAVLDKVLYAATGAVNPNFLSNQKPIIQLRIYTDGQASPLRESVENIRNYLVNPQMFSTVDNKITADVKIQNNFKLNYSDIEMFEVDINNTTLSPSSSAWNSARIIEVAGISGASNINDEVFLPRVDYSKKDKESVSANSFLDDIIMNNIIDIWVSFKSVEISKEKTNQNNQASQETNADVDAAIKAGR